MPIYNAQEHLAEAIRSILGQSSSDLEFVMIDDGSLDHSREIVEGFSDTRIVFAKNEKNLGVRDTLNKGLELCSGRYVARMDADDVSLPRRLETQVRYLESHSEVGVCGTWVGTIGRWHEGFEDYPVDHESIRAQMIFSCPVAHPSVMLRRELFSKAHLRYEQPYAEDYDLWSRAIERMGFHNIPQRLMKYRFSSAGISRTWRKQEYLACAEEVMRRGLSRLGISPDAEEMNAHAFSFKEIGLPALKSSERWLIRLLEANRDKKVYDAAAFERTVYKRWLYVCTRSTGLGWAAWRSFRDSPLHRLAPAAPFWRENLKIAVKSALRFDRNRLGIPS